MEFLGNSTNTAPAQSDQHYGAFEQTRILQFSFFELFPDIRGDEYHIT